MASGGLSFSFEIKPTQSPVWKCQYISAIGKPVSDFRRSSARLPLLVHFMTTHSVKNLLKKRKGESPGLARSISFGWMSNEWNV